jgi:phospholipase C
MMRLRTAAVALGVATLVVALIGLPQVAAEEPGPEPQPATPIKHFIFLMQENHSFDNYFGTYPGADGIPAGTCMPVDLTNQTSTECIEPFHIGSSPVQDLGHNTRVFAGEFRGGAMDGFVDVFTRRGSDGSTVMGYYDDSDLPYYWNIADEYVLFDRFFTSAAGGSVWNHLYWVTGTPGNYADDTIPLQGFGDLPTIFDRLEEGGISWKFYVQNYNPHITYRSSGEGDRASQVVWVPLLNYARYIDNPSLFSHIVDLSEYFDDLNNGTLPAVAYIVPSGASEHPPGSIQSGQRSVRRLITALMRSDAWYDSAFMWSYDDWGGWYDHVAPPAVDAFGYGFRAPALLVSPYARRGYIDSTTLDFASVPKFIEENWGLQPLAERDAKANSLMSAFDFSQPPRRPVFLSATRWEQAPKEPRRGVIYAAYGATLSLSGLLIIWVAIGVSVLRRRVARRGHESASGGRSP